jgi:hypothetical protein
MIALESSIVHKKALSNLSLEENLFASGLLS